MFKQILRYVFDNQGIKKNKINILMIGNSGVGKTSTLTAMYDRFNRVVDKNLELQLIPDDKTANKLSIKLKELKRQIGSDLIRAKPTLSGTSYHNDFKFIVAKDEDSSKRIELIFKDFPGGYLESERQKVKNWIKESDVIVIPIDTPALLEEGGIYNEEANSPEKIYDIFRSVKGSFELKNRLILLVPLKSEKYLSGNLYYTNNIRDAIEREFANLLDFFQISSLKHKVAVIMTTIQTLGDIKFSMIEKNQDGKPIFIYKKKDFGAKYSPKDTEQPLKYILAFAISEVLSKRSKLNSKITDFFEFDKEFLETLDTFANDFKQDHNFVIFQGKELLKQREIL